MQRLEHGCKEQGCPARITSASAYCDAHRHQHEREYAHERRDTPHRFYNLAIWKKIRRIQLSRFPMCAEKDFDGSPCRNAATTADHIKDHEGNWELFVDLKNLQSLCTSHHSEKTAKRAAARRRNHGG